LFVRVLNKIDRKSRKIPIYRVNNPDFPIRGLVKHEPCGVELTASWSTGNGGKYAYYRCKECTKIHFKKDKIEDSFVHYLDNYKLKSELKNAFLIAIEANLTHRNEINIKNQRKIEKDIISEKAKIRQITEKNIKGVYGDNLTREMIGESEEKITDLSLQLDSFEVNKDEMMKIAEKSLSVLENIGNVWEKAELDIKQRFQKFLFPDGLYYDGSDFRTNKLALCIEPKWTMAPQMLQMVSPLYHRWNSFSIV
jgi:hypothetical protein